MRTQTIKDITSLFDTYEGTYYILKPKCRYYIINNSSSSLIIFNTDKMSLDIPVYNIIKLGRNYFENLVKKGRCIIEDDDNIAEFQYNEDSIVVKYGSNNIYNIEMIKLNNKNSVKEYLMGLYLVLTKTNYYNTGLSENMIRKYYSYEKFYDQFHKDTNIIANTDNPYDLIRKMRIHINRLMNNYDISSAENYRSVINNSEFFSGYVKINKMTYDEKYDTPNILNQYNKSDIVCITFRYGLIINDRTFKEMVDLINNNKRKIISEVNRIAELHHLTRKIFKEYDTKLVKMKIIANWELHVEYSVSPTFRVRTKNVKFVSNKQNCGG